MVGERLPWCWLVGLPEREAGLCGHVAYDSVFIAMFQLVSLPFRLCSSSLDFHGDTDSYVFPFEPNPMWSKFYVGGEEIKQYIINTAEKYRLKEKITFNTKLVKAVWDEEQAKWRLQLECGDSIRDDEADVLIDAKGILKWVPSLR